MLILRRLRVLLCLAFAAIPTCAIAQQQNAQIDLSPFAFEPNLGQTFADYQFLARQNGMLTLCTSDGMDVFVRQSQSKSVKLKLRWTNANRRVVIEGEEPLPGASNYIHGQDESQWIRGVPQFARIRYTEIYRGIDLLFHGRDGQLENDFVLKAGANPSDISLRLDHPSHIAGSGQSRASSHLHSGYFAHRGLHGTTKL